MLSDHLTYLIETQEPVADLSRLAEHLPYEWIEHAVRATGTASLRWRRLPAEQVIWLGFLWPCTGSNQSVKCLTDSIWRCPARMHHSSARAR